MSVYYLLRKAHETFRTQTLMMRESLFVRIRAVIRQPGLPDKVSVQKLKSREDAMQSQ